VETAQTEDAAVGKVRATVPKLDVIYRADAGAKAAALAALIGVESGATVSLGRPVYGSPDPIGQRAHGASGQGLADCLH
jgi:hypothetical protein